MDTGVIIMFIIIGLFIAFKIDQNMKMMKYRKLYDQALREKNKARALEYGRHYHRYRSGMSAKHTAAAELIIANDMKAAGINQDK